MYTWLSIAALIAEAILLAYVIIQGVRRGEVISKRAFWYAIPVFILVYALYVIGYSYTGEEMYITVFLKFASAALQTFVFDIELSFVKDLALDNGVYLAAMTIGFLFAGATLVASLISLFGASIMNVFRVKKAIKGNAEFVLGDSEDALSYARRNGAVVVALTSGDRARQIMSGHIGLIRTWFSPRPNRGLSAWLSRRLVKGRMYHFIAFRDNRFVYSDLISDFIAEFRDLKDVGFTLHIQATLTEMDVINRRFIDANKCDNICIKSFSRYELGARKFIIDYPISRFLPESFYGKYRTILPEKKINVIFLGFGKVNYKLMSMMIMQNQFVGLGDGKFVNHPVDYYVYDSDEGRLHTDLLMNIDFDCSEISSPDLPPPEPLCRVVETECVNIHTPSFIDKLKKLVRDENAFSYVIVSVGSDFENVSYAERLFDLRKKTDNVMIFARTRENKFASAEKNGVYMFGNDNEILSKEVIVNEALDGVSRRLNAIYNDSSRSEIIAYNARPAIEMYSNIYHSISVFFKINLLGMDFVRAAAADGRERVSKDELFASFGGFPTERKYEDYFSLSVWNMLGFSEHSRWVAQYVLKGFRPMPFDEIVAEKYVENGKEKFKVVSKNVGARRHCCITDFYGLDKYHRHILKVWQDNGYIKTTIDDVETYQYDFMFLSEAYDRMAENGYVLVRRSGE